MIINANNASFSVSVLEITLWVKPFERRFLGLRLAWENCRYFVKPPLVSPRNNVVCHYPNLGSASATMKKIPFAVRPIRSTTQIWVVTRHQYGISSPVPPQTSFRGETSGGVVKYWLFPQPRSQGSLLLRGKKRENPGNEVALFSFLL